MDDENVQALEELRANGNLSEHVRLRGMELCPHCHQGFGRASLPIHMRRCRALLPPTEEEDKALKQDKPAKPMRRKEVRSLVDLCLRFVTRHFESICMDRIVAFPEAEGTDSVCLCVCRLAAALIATMPSNLVHRMVVNLVKESKTVKMKNRESRAMIETLESALQGARRDVAQLESARDWAAISRVRMAEQQLVAERLQRELDTTKTALASAEAENQQIRAKTESREKKILRLEARINTLNVEKSTLKKVSTEARRHEMEATKLLAMEKKASTTRSTSFHGRSSRSESSRERIQHSERSRSSWASSHLSSEEINASRSFTSSTAAIIYRNRPRANGSKIPYPASVYTKDYLVG